MKTMLLLFSVLILSFSVLANAEVNENPSPPVAASSSDPMQVYDPSCGCFKPVSNSMACSKTSSDYNTPACMHPTGAAAPATTKGATGTAGSSN